MKKIIAVKILLLVFLSSCNTPGAKETANKLPGIIYSPENVTSKIDESWKYEINNSYVGLISTQSHISSLENYLPESYKLISNFIKFDGDDQDEPDEDSLVYDVLEDSNLIFRIIPQHDKKNIYSIMVFSPLYKILNTDLHVGSTVKDLKNIYSIKDSYFNIADGLYIYCNEFNGAFSIDLEGEGDKFESLETLSDNKKVKSIIIY